MTDLRKAAEMALEALLEANNSALMELSIDDAYSDEITALRQALAQPEQPMSPEHLPRYVATNGVKPMEGGGGGGSQPEPDWTTDTPIPPFKYLDLPEYKTTQPEQEPVAWVKDGVLWNSDLPEKFTGCLYTAPPNREWEFLGDDEVIALANKEGWNIQVEDFPANLLRLRVGALGMAIQKEFWRKNK